MSSDGVKEEGRAAQSTSGEETDQQDEQMTAATTGEGAPKAAADGANEDEEGGLSVKVEQASGESPVADEPSEKKQTDAGESSTSNQDADVEAESAKPAAAREAEGVSTFALYQAMSEGQAPAPAPPAASPWRVAPGGRGAYLPPTSPATPSGMPSPARPYYPTQAATAIPPPASAIPPAFTHPFAPPLSEAAAGSEHYDWWSAYYGHYYQIISFTPGVPPPPLPPNPWVLPNLPLPRGALEGAIASMSPSNKRRKLAAPGSPGGGNSQQYAAFAVPGAISKTSPAVGPTAGV